MSRHRMLTMHSVDDVIQHYQTLRQYCDTVFAATRARFQDDMRCARGCAACCVLETVTPLEAFVIESYLHASGETEFSDALRSGRCDESACVFLDEKRCLIYPVRPLICRTHGLPLFYKERQAIEVCPLNFTAIDFAAFDAHFLLDAEVMADNLMRLNLAFGMLTGTTERAGERVALRELRRQVTHDAIGRLP